MRMFFKQIDRSQILLVILIIVFFCLFSMIGLWRHWGYLTSLNDLGHFDQAIWGALNGYSLLNTDVFAQPMNRLGVHFDPILYAFIPLYLIEPNAYWLILAQSGAVAIAAWPIFSIAHLVTGCRKSALIWAGAYLCNPFLLNAVAWDFHPVSLAVLFITLALLAVEKKRPVFLVFACLIIITCKEHFGLAVAGLGVLYWVRHRNWLIGSSLLLAGMGALVVIVQVIMPIFSFNEQHIMLGEGMGQLSRYSWLGSSIEEIIKNFLNDPLFVMQRVLLDMGGLKYLGLLLLPFLFFPLAAPFWLLPATADLLANLLSANPMPRGIFSYHSVTIIPVLVVAAIHGCSKLTWLRKRFSLMELSSFVLLINFILGYWLAPFPLPGSANMWQAVSPLASYDKRETRVKELVGDKSLSVQANIGAHFSQRTAIYRYPAKIEEVDFIVLRLESPTKRLQPYEKGAIGTLAHHLQMPPEQYLDSVEEILYNERYNILLWDSPWLVIGRNKQPQAEVKSVHLKINQLRTEWIGIEY